ncbi:MAG: adenine deaminase [Actinobacteria bacterium]|nr:adenine deaminase [Actinomycetota bacterium]MCG2818980.1 adenine deaminase [Actinomycetes bacterium]MBU4217820.1 adenine deaminase [Actinomycetota bacterium]MBU4359342.1 adenine deaminase [Actinomycetota bacterium]MBU4392444.1 adenine deaminase [Actinomycetota bacterium]
MDLEDRIGVARGEGEVDLLIENCRLVNVLSGRVHRASVAVAGGTVVGLDGGYSARETIDLKGKYLAPGLIDVHVHLESSMTTVGQFARAVVPRGTTAVFTDCHEIANVMGVSGIEYMVKSADGAPLDVFVMLPPCVPATNLETSGADLEAADLEPLVGEPWAIGIGEMMNFPGTIARDPGIMAKIRLFPDGPIEGHAPGLSGEDLCAYIAAGPNSEHECTTAAEAEEKLRKGMYLYLREGTGARNLLDLLPVVNDANRYRCCFCIDDRSPEDLLERGHIDSMLKMVTDAGVSPLNAIQMATINSARRMGLESRGAVAVGFRADMIVLDDLGEFRVSTVFKDGRVVARDGELTVPTGDEPEIGSTFNVAGFSAGRLCIPADGGTARMIGVTPGQIVTGSLTCRPPVEGGDAVADPGADVLKIAVVERHKGTGNVGVAFVKGFGLRSGALASSVAHDSHNVVVVGCSDEDMAVAVEKVVAMGGGQAVAAGGEARAALALPIGGLMSPLPVAEVAGQVRELNLAAAGLGCSLQDPFMAMSFLALPVIPSLKITDMGLVDVGEFKHVSVFV